MSFVFRAFVFIFTVVSLEASSETSPITTGCPRKKGDLRFGFVVATVISKLLMHICEKMRLVYDSQAHAGELSILLLML